VFSRFKFLRTAKTRCTAVVKRCAFFAPKTEPVRLAHNTFTKSGPAKIHRGVDLISDALPFGRLWYGEPNAISNAIGYAMHRSRSHYAVIRVYDSAVDVIETHEHAGEFKE
jgi:hypothetical protein